MTLSTCNINLDEISTPFFIYKPDMIKKKVEFFLNYFSGETLYAVKTNPSKFVLKTIYKFGIKSFDVASVTAGSEVVSFVSTSGLPIGTTFSHVKPTLTREFSMKIGSMIMDV